MAQSRPAHPLRSCSITRHRTPAEQHSSADLCWAQHCCWCLCGLSLKKILHYCLHQKPSVITWVTQQVGNAAILGGRPSNRRAHVTAPEEGGLPAATSTGACWVPALPSGRAFCEEAEASLTPEGAGRWDEAAIWEGATSTCTAHHHFATFLGVQAALQFGGNRSWLRPKWLAKAGRCDS